MRDKLSTRFFLHYPQGGDAVKATTKAELPKIYLRITVNRKKTELTLGYSIMPQYWDDRKQRTKNDKRLNEELTFIENRILEIKREMQYTGQEVSAIRIKDKFLGKAEVETYLCLYYQQFIDKMEKLPSYSRAMLSKHKNALQHVKDFLATSKLSDVKIEKLDFKWIQDFDYFMLTVKHEPYNRVLSRNTATKQHALIKALLEKAIQENLLGRNPYTGVRMKSVKSVRDFLTIEEIDTLKKHTFGGNLSLQKVRDVFLFSVYTGLRYVDAMGLKTEHIVKDKEGKFWINKIQEKTGERVMVPLLKYAVDIYEKYDNEERSITGHILPRITNQKVNAYLKIIAQLADIKKKITHHMGRHTFATTITLSNDVPLEVVSKWLGHSSIKTSQIYAKITTQYFSTIASRLDNKL
jgi:integrase/recombinase XerD